MKDILLIIFFIIGACSINSSLAQEPKTIRIKKESNLAKAVFDNADLKLMVIDRFGNAKDNKIVSYKLYVKTKKETKEFVGFSNALNAEMINYLNKLTKATKLFFTEIQVKDDYEHLVSLPDVIEVWFPNCSNCEPHKARR